MNIPYYMTAIDGLTSEIDELLTYFVKDGYQHLASYMTIPLVTSMSLYLIGLGLASMMGWMPLSLSQLTRTAFKFAWIAMAALNWGWFSHTVYELFVTASGQVGDVLLHATPIPFPHFAGEGIDGGLQTVLIEFTKIGVWAWVTGSWHNLGPFINALLIWGFGFSLLFVGLFECILAKIMLALLLATAPLFIGFTLFPVTQGLFDRWLGACTGFSLLMVLISAVLALTLNLAEWAIGGLYASHASHLTLIGFVPIVMIGFIGIGIILKTAQLAHHIAGSVTSMSTSSVLAGFLAGFMGGGLRRIRSNRNHGANDHNEGGQVTDEQQQSSKYTNQASRQMATRVSLVQPR